MFRVFMSYTYLYPFLRYLRFYVKFTIFSLQNNNFNLYACQETFSSWFLCFVLLYKVCSKSG